MKATVNIRDFIEDNADHGDMLLVHATFDVDDLFETNCIPEEHEFDLDLDALLEEYRQVAIIWTIYHVQEIRPDLSADQSWEVLKTCRARWGSCQAIDWEVIEKTAGELYGPTPERRWHGRIDVTITDTDGYGPQEALIRFRDMARLLSKDMPDVVATVDEGAVRYSEPGETSSR